MEIGTFIAFFCGQILGTLSIMLYYKKAEEKASNLLLRKLKRLTAIKKQVSSNTDHLLKTKEHLGVLQRQLFYLLEYFQHNLKQQKLILFSKGENKGKKAEEDKKEFTILELVKKLQKEQNDKG